jgi:hypothetical protein
MRFQTTLRLLQMTGPRSSVHSLRELRVVLMLRPPCASLNTAVAAITARPTSAWTWELLLPEPRDADGEDQPRRRRPEVTCPLADHGIIR